MILSSLLLGGCAAPVTEPVLSDPSAPARYRTIQAAQQNPPVRKVTIQVPERIENGVRKVPTTVELEFP